MNKKNTKSKWMGILLLPLGLIATHAVASIDTSLDDELQSLRVSENEMPKIVNQEKLFSVKDRYSPMSNRLEVSLGGGMNMTAPGFIDSQEGLFSARYFFSDQLYTKLGASYVGNGLSDSGALLLETDGIVPDLAYVKNRFDLLVGYQTFYGKFRLSMNSVLYFDHYVELGPGYLFLNASKSLSAVGGTGFVFWLGDWGSVRVGVRDYFFKEKRRLSEQSVHHLVTHLNVGYIIGGVNE